MPLIFYIKLATLAFLFPPKNPPLFFAMRGELQEVEKSQPVSTFQGKDTSVHHELQLLYDRENKPLLYYANINTPVCIDNVCKPVFVEIYWNLLGNYVGYGVHPNKPLTKYDHELFTSEDHQQLNDLLHDKHSILGRRSLSALFDPNATADKVIEYDGQQVDAVSGATRKEVRQSVVEGALFSCYSLWYLVHDESRRIIRDNLKDISSSDILHSFLDSGYPDYYYYALKHLPTEALSDQLAVVAKHYSNAAPLAQSYLLKKLPESVWQNPSKSHTLFSLFRTSDINARSLLLAKLQYAPASVFDALTEYFHIMTGKQIGLYLDTLRQRQDAQSETLLARMKVWQEREDFVFGYLLSKFIEAE